MGRTRCKHIELSDDDYYDYDNDSNYYSEDEEDVKNKNNNETKKVKDKEIINLNNQRNIVEKSNIKLSNTITFTKETIKKQDNSSIFIENYICTVLGHVDSGKSTLMGQLFVTLGLINENLLRKYKKESEMIGKRSFAYAWIFDECDDERERGITINISAKYLKINNKLITLLDTPGHSELIPNSFSVTMFSDNIIIVIDSNNFNSNFDKGQTKEYIISSLIGNVSNIIITINKLDLFNWDKDIYDNIVKTINDYINNELYDIKNDCNIIYLPISAYNAININSNYCYNQDEKIISHELYKWYNGPSLLDILLSINRDKNKYNHNLDICNCSGNDKSKEFIKLSACIIDIISISSNEFKASIYIDFGTIKIGNNYVILPNNEIIRCKTIIINEKNHNSCIGPIYVSSITFQSNIHPNIGNMVISSSFNKNRNKNSRMDHILLSNMYPILITKRIKIRKLKLINELYFESNRIYWEIPGKSFMLYYHCESITATLVFIKNDIYYFETDQEIVSYNKCLCNDKSNLSKVSVRFFGTTVFIGEMIYYL